MWLKPSALKPTWFGSRADLHGRQTWFNLGRSSAERIMCPSFTLFCSLQSCVPGWTLFDTPGLKIQLDFSCYLSFVIYIYSNLRLPQDRFRAPATPVCIKRFQKMRERNNATHSYKAYSISLEQQYNRFEDVWCKMSHSKETYWVRIVWKSGDRNKTKC